jgi:hypothetical protein
MNNQTKYIVTCRFPSWGEKKEYEAFGIEYLIEIPFDEEDVEKEFMKKWKEKIGRGVEDFNGEILFIKEVEYCIL